MNKTQLVFCYRYRKRLYRKIQTSFVLMYPEQGLIFSEAKYIAHNNWVRSFIGEVCCRDINNLMNFWKRQERVYLFNLNEYKEVKQGSKYLLYFLPQVFEAGIHLIPIYSSV
jgi:hypothetical protein